MSPIPIPIPVPVPIPSVIVVTREPIQSPQPDDETETELSPKVNVTVSVDDDYQCPAVGEECSSALSQEDRCCDGQSGGSTRCKYKEWDDDGYKMGTCCVRNNRRCTEDMDCCGDDMVCHLGYCLEPTRYDDNALHISDDGEFAEWVGDDAMEGEIYGISKSL